MIEIAVALGAAWRRNAWAMWREPARFCWIEARKAGALTVAIGSRGPIVAALLTRMSILLFSVLARKSEKAVSTSDWFVTSVG